MKNTIGNYKITKKKLINKFILIGGISVSSFFMNNFVHADTVEDLGSHYVMQFDENVVFGDQNYADQLYQEALNSLKDVDFDYNFINICDSVVFVIDGVEHDCNDFYLRVMDDGGVYFSDLMNKDVDIFTGKKYDGDRIKTIPVYKSSMFYEMYRDGVIPNTPKVQIVLDENLKKVFLEYLKNWDGMIHSKTIDSAIDSQISSIIEKQKVKK